MKDSSHVALDLGAESGRVILGLLERGKVRLEEVHRFPNIPILRDGGIFTDMPMILRELTMGLKKVTASGVRPLSLSTDSWGVDYVYFNLENSLLADPYQYRDTRTEGIPARVFEKVPFRDVFEKTGIQFMPINTLYQMVDDLGRRPEVLKVADQFLCIGDYVNYRFSGVARAEESLASTTQLYQPHDRAWAEGLIQKLGLSRNLFPPLVASGTRLGGVLPELAVETGLAGVEVVATCSHDTGAAVAAVPAEGEDWAYLSSGTWSLLGIESLHPVITAESLRHNFTNEVGVEGTTRLLKNIVGLWIVQECRRVWQKEGRDYSYDELATMARSAVPLRSLIHPSAPPFGQPGDMPRKIMDYCRATGQPVPSTPGETICCVYQSLALLYRQVLGQLEAVSGRAIRRLHIVGGGSKSRLLNQWTAHATGLSVIAGPVEATALGNVLIQSMAMGHLASLKELRAVVKKSFSLETHDPADAGVWDSAATRFEQLPTTLCP